MDISEIRSKLKQISKLHNQYQTALYYLRSNNNKVLDSSVLVLIYSKLEKSMPSFSDARVRFDNYIGIHHIGENLDNITIFELIPDTKSTDFKKLLVRKLNFDNSSHHLSLDGHVNQIEQRLMYNLESKITHVSHIMLVYGLIEIMLLCVCSFIPIHSIICTIFEALGGGIGFSFIHFFSKRSTLKHHLNSINYTRSTAKPHDLYKAIASADTSLMQSHIRLCNLLNKHIKHEKKLSYQKTTPLDHLNYINHHGISWNQAQNHINNVKSRKVIKPVNPYLTK